MKHTKYLARSLLTTYVANGATIIFGSRRVLADRSPITVFFESLILEDTRFDEFLDERESGLLYILLCSESNATNIASTGLGPFLIKPRDLKIHQSSHPFPSIPTRSTEGNKARVHPRRVWPKLIPPDDEILSH